MVASVAAHGVALLVLGNLKSTDLANAATKIEVFDAKTAEAPPPPPPPPPKPKAEPPKPKPRAQSAEPAPPLATDLSPSALSNAPDFGLSLSGGVAVAPPAAAGARTVNRARAETRQGPARAADNLKPSQALGCADPPAKPKVLSLPRPAYTDQARSAGVEGKVRIQLTVDTSGSVTQVRVLAGLGYGLDEAAVQAARQARFEPAVRCGKPESSTFTISMRFTAS
jgi:protein TonB